ncbi:MAG: 30S ribosomal protein S8e [Candidatus Geothermarchaeota archaeon]
MVLYHWDLHKKKKSGGKRRIWRKKRRYERGGEPVNTTIGPHKVKVARCKGGGTKVKLLSVDYANVNDPKTGKTIKAKIMAVIGNDANKEFVKRGIITKGAIIRTEIGDAKVTSRPGQHGVVNAVIIDHQK